MFSKLTLPKTNTTNIKDKSVKKMNQVVSTLINIHKANLREMLNDKGERIEHDENKIVNNIRMIFKERKNIETDRKSCLRKRLERIIEKDNNVLFSKVDLIDAKKSIKKGDVKAKLIIKQQIDFDAENTKTQSNKHMANIEDAEVNLDGKNDIVILPELNDEIIKPEQIAEVKPEIIQEIKVEVKNEFGYRKLKPFKHRLQLKIPEPINLHMQYVNKQKNDSIGEFINRKIRSLKIKSNNFNYVTCLNDMSKTIFERLAFNTTISHSYKLIN